MNQIISVLFPHSRYTAKDSRVNDGISVDRLLQYPTQHRLSSVDTAILSEYLRVSENDLRGHLSQLERLKADCSDLEARCRALEQRVDKCRSLLSPANKCPPEVLLEIFKYVCETNVLEFTPPPAALVLSGVCRTWRSILLDPSTSSQSLWSNLHIPFRLWKDDACALTTVTHLFLKRSMKSSRLGLVLDFSQVPLLFEMRFLPTLKILVEQSSRWAHLSLFLSPDIIRHPVFEPISGNIPNLQHLEFFVTPGANSLPSLPLDLFLQAPNLHGLNIYPRNTGDERIFTIPYNQIIQLSVGPCSAQAALDFLTSFQSLRRLSIAKIGGHRLSSAPSLILPQLQELTIFARNTEEANSLFHRSSFPRLSVLEIEALPERDQSVDWVLPCLRCCISHSQCQITEIYLRDLPMCGTELLWLLLLTPAVHTLEVRTWHCTAETLRMLINKPSIQQGPHETNEGPLLPVLEQSNIQVTQDDSTHKVYARTGVA